MEEARPLANENGEKKNVPTAAGTAKTSQKSKKLDVNSLFFGSSSAESGSTVKPKKSEEGEPLGGMKKSGGRKSPGKVPEKSRKKPEICSSVKFWYFFDIKEPRDFFFTQSVQENRLSRGCRPNRLAARPRRPASPSLRRRKPSRICWQRSTFYSRPRRFWMRSKRRLWRQRLKVRGHSVNESINQRVNWTVNIDPVNQSINQSMEGSTNILINQSINHTIESRSSTVLNQSINYTIESRSSTVLNQSINRLK